MGGALTGAGRIRTAALVLAGDELVTGARQDRNGPWMARALSAHGVHVVGLFVARDHVEDLAHAIATAAGLAELVLVSGGLGPTEDDRTRDALARAGHTTRVARPDALAAMRAILEQRGLPVRAGHEDQARLPATSTWLTNPVGVAVGIEMPIGPTTVVALPGVPRELHAMFEVHVAPRLTRQEVAHTSVCVIGMPEPEVEETVAPRLENFDLLVGFYPHTGEVEVRLVALGPGAAARVEAGAAACLAALGEDGYRPPPEGLIEHAVVELLTHRKETLAIAESVTGGLLARLVTGVPGSSAVFRAGVVTYATDAKGALLGVPAATVHEHGVVSEAVAASMAEGVRERASATHALATTGVAGPGPWEQPDGRIDPVGRICFGLASEGRATTTVTMNYRGDRDAIQQRAARFALDLLRRRL